MRKPVVYFFLAMVLNLMLCVGAFAKDVTGSLSLKPVDNAGETHQLVWSGNGGQPLAEITRRGDKDFLFMALGPKYVEKSYEIWEGFTGSKDPLINAAYFDACLTQCESRFFGDLAEKCEINLIDTADGVGGDVTHVDKFRAFGFYDGFKLLCAEGTVNNKGGSELQLFSGNGKVKGTEVRMRSYCSTDSNILGEFTDGEELMIIGYMQGSAGNGAWDWAYVKRSNGQKCFIYAQFAERHTKP